MVRMPRRDVSMKYHDTRRTKPSSGPAGSRWGSAAIAGVLACALAIAASTALALGGAETALAEEGNLTVATVGSSSTTTDLADGGTYDLTNYRGSDKAQILRIKNAGTYRFVQSGPDAITNVQIKVDASSASKVIIWLDGVTIDDSNHNLSAVNIEGDSNVEIHSANGSQSTLIGGAEDEGSDDGGAGVYVNDDASVLFASDAHIVARGGCFWMNGQEQSLRAAGIGGSGSGNSDSGTIVFEEGCTIEASGATGEKGGAGIGSGYDGISGKIVIYGGTIAATGGPKAAGIGSASADGGGNGGNVEGDIDIMSGTIIAIGGEGAAGIGSGKDGGLDAGIYLSGGDIAANAGGDAAAIGTGVSGTLKENRGISISGGTVTTSGGSVGMGFGASGSADKGTYLKITGGTIYTDSVSKDSNFRITIVGGLVPANLGDGIVNESGQNVYWMALPVPDPGADVESIASNSDFSSRSVHPDENGFVYVYLPASNGQNVDENKVTLVQNGKTYQYHDKHTEAGDVNNPGYLKMDSPEVSIHASEDPISPGGSTWIYLDDSDPLLVPDATTAWENRGCAWYLTDSVNIDGNVDHQNSPGAGKWIYVHTDTSGTYSVTAELASNTKGYWAHTYSVTFTGTILTKPDIQIADLTKPYDGVAITPDTAKSQVTTNSDGEITVALQQQVDGGWKDVASAIEIGHYRVTAATAKTDSFGEWSETQEFDILPAATATSVSAVRNVVGSTVTGWTLTAQVGGFVPGDGQGTVTFANTTSGLSNVLGTAQVDANGKASLVISSEGVIPGTYEVTATYEGTSAYGPSKGTFKGFSDLSTRAVTGNASREVVYEKGKTFSLDLGTDSPLTTDAWSYEVVTDSYAGFAKADGIPAGATVTVDDKGAVTVNHAGTATIKVTLVDGAATMTYQDAVAYVTVTVDKAALVVAPYAAAEDGAPVTSATYGSLDGLSTGLLYSYDGGKSWTATAPDWNDGFVGSLAAGQIDTAAQVGTFDVPATQNPGSFSVNGTTHEGFYARDYEIAYSTAYRLSVAKRSLVVTLNDAWGVYGGATPEVGWSYDESAQPEDGGLAGFDTADRVFQEKPVLAIDAQVTGTADFASTPVRYADNGDVAAYEGAVSAQGGVSANYDVEFVKGDLTIYPEKLSDTGRIAVTGGSDFTYDGSAHGPSGYVVSDAGSELVVGRDYRLSVEGNTTDGGTVTVAFAGMGNYSGTVTATYTIAPAELTVRTPSARKTYDGVPLAADGGTVLEGLVAGETATAKATGSVTDAGVSDNTYEIAWGTAKESNYKVHQDLGTLEVLPRTLTVATYSAKKQYDGKPLTAGGSLQGLVMGETVLLKTTGSQTEVGSSDNTFDIAWGSAKESNYEVDPFVGTLTVEPNTAAITLTAPSSTKHYDGTPLAALGYKVSGLPRDFSVEAEVAGAQTEVGNSESTIGSYAIYDAAGNDVTAYFPNVTKVAGTLEVTEGEGSATDPTEAGVSIVAEPSTSGTSGMPGAPDAPGTSGAARNAEEAPTAQASSLPETGDAAVTGLAVALLVAGVGALAAAYILHRRRS